MLANKQLSFGILLTLAALLGSVAHGAPPATAQPTPEAAAFFENKVRPILFEKCFSCHGDAKQSGGLRLNSRSALVQGGDDGPVVTANDPMKSALLRAVNYEGRFKMPPTGRLKPEEIAALTDWVKIGAPWPEAKGAAGPSGGPAAPIWTAAQKDYWCFRPVKKPVLPSVTHKQWGRSPIDAFILAGLEQKQLSPAPPADKHTLIRRATFDLTGLPPTPKETNAFLADKSPDAFAHVVDRLLASPRYGERWARHWLDVVRYTDSLDRRGLGSEGDVAFAWRYRDWVINALNQDMPFNQFVINQIAGDILPAPGGAGINRDGTIATGLLAIGNWGDGDADKEKLLTDIADDQVDVVSRGFMGLTVACARCHNHKFDPISNRDYYGMAGIFFSTHILPHVADKGAGETILRVPLLSKTDIDKREQWTKQVAALETKSKTDREAAVRSFAHSLLPQTAKYLVSVWDWQHRPADQPKLALAEFAAQRGLHAYALRQWLEMMDAGDYRLMTVASGNTGNTPGIYSWRGAADCPNALINSTDKAVTLTTLTLPPHCVSVHPGPANGVVAAWVSPVTGLVSITGKVVDADPNCGNGIAWMIDHRVNGAPTEMASGDFPNGGQQAFAQGKGGGNLQSISVTAGDRIDLLVLPKGDYSCDTTIADITIALKDGSRSWNLAHDMMIDPIKSNPHADSYGNQGVWRFLDMADSKRGTQSQGATGSILAQFYQSATPTADHAVVEQAAAAFQKGFTADDATSPFTVRTPEDGAALPPDVHAALVKAASDLAALKKNPPAEPDYANAAQEGGCPASPQAGFHDVHIHIRGSYMKLGDLVPRHFPTIIAGDRQAPITQGSGRLELARWIAGDTHPLTSRVIVNRIWQHHFGVGIVRTPSNFGFLGERPTHPELLDWLASTFVQSGWSIKRMHRMIMLSAAYQQSSVPPIKTTQIDPDNRLFGHMNRLRLEAEGLRDNLLAVTGKLDFAMGGPATQDFNAPRRTVYLMTVRSDRSGFGPLFDAADSTASVEKRTISTVAPQALFLLNNTFVLDQAKGLARQMLQVSPDDTGRIQTAYLRLFGRPASPEEVRIGLAFLARSRSTPTAASARTASLPGAPDGAKDQSAWEEYCHILLCTNEFMYVD